MNFARGMQTSLARLYRIYWTGTGKGEESEFDLNEYKTDSDSDDENESEEDEDEDIDHDALCGICMDTPVNFDFSSRFKHYPSCKHIANNYCNSCVYKYTNEQIESKKFGLMKCPYPSCNNQFNKKFVKEVVDNNTYTHYLTEKRNIREELKSRRNPFYAIKKYAMTMWDNLVMNFKTLARRSDERYSRRCPSCSYIIEKNGGCDHMTCCVCHHEFYWCCGLTHRGGHSQLACFISRYWFICILLTGIIYLSLPLFVAIASFLSALLSYISFPTLCTGIQVSVCENIKIAIFFILRIPDAAILFMIWRYSLYMFQEYQFFGIDYGSFVYNTLRFIDNHCYLSTTIYLLLQAFYVPPSYAIIDLCTGTFRSIACLGTAMNVITSNNSYYIAGVKFMLSNLQWIKGVVFHTRTSHILEKAFKMSVGLGLTLWNATCVKVIVAANIDNMKKKYRGIVITPSMKELTNLLLLPEMLISLSFWRVWKVLSNLKYIINNPLATVMLSVSIFLMGGHQALVYSCFLLWESICFVRQFKGLNSICVDKCATAEFVLPTIVASSLLSVIVFISVFTVARTLLFSPLPFFNEPLITAIGRIFCDPTIDITLVVILSTYYYVTRVI